MVGRRDFPLIDSGTVGERNTVINLLKLKLQVQCWPGSQLQPTCMPGYTNHQTMYRLGGELYIHEPHCYLRVNIFMQSACTCMYMYMYTLYLYLHMHNAYQ